jgi:hypothetical protein
MLEGLLEKCAAPAGWLRFALGVLRMVPVCDMIAEGLLCWQYTVEGPSLVVEEPVRMVV